MIVGTEGVHTWDGGAAVLNRRDLRPHYRVTEIDGLRSLGDFDNLSDRALGRTGEVPRSASRAGKTLVYQGFVVGPGLASLRAASGALTAAFAATDERQMICAPHPAYAGGDLPQRSFRARCLSCEVDDGEMRPATDPRSDGYAQPFSVALRLSDPRYYHVGGDVDVTDDVPAAEGGAGVPFTPGGYVDPPSTQGFEVVTDNPGNADVDGLFYMYGPLANPVLSNETLGLFLRFASLTLAAGDYAIVDFRRRKVNRDSGENVRHTLDPASTWWDRLAPCLAPGPNTIRLRGYRVDAGAKLRVTYAPADYA